METYEAITSRRSVAKTTDRAPGRAEIEKILHAAVRAPTHHLSQPWRFIVLKGASLDGLGDAWAAGTAREGKDPESVRAKPHRAPVIIAVIERPRLQNPKVVEVEEHHATGAAMQNALLAAHDMGLGAMLRTGPAAALPEVHDFLGVGDDELIAGFIYVGYPDPNDAARPRTRRADPSDVTEWWGWT